MKSLTIQNTMNFKKL